MAKRVRITITVLAFLGAGASIGAAQGLSALAKPAPGAATAGPAAHTPDGQPDLGGYWTNATVTPLERPKELADKAFFTPQEAAEYAKRQLAVPEATGPGTYADVHYNMAQFGLEKSQSKVAANIRTSLISDPPDGRIPPMTPEARKRAADRAALNKGHEFDGPENRTLGERCILWPNEGPPMMPAGYNSNLADRAGPRLRRHHAGDDSRRPYDSYRRQPASSVHDSAVDGRLARPLGGRHAGGGHHEFHRPDRIPRLQRESARGGALPARGCEHRPLSIHRGRPFHLDPLLERGDSDDQDPGPAL